MTYSTHLLVALATVPALALREQIRNVLDRQTQPIADALLGFHAQPCSPAATFDLERQLAACLRDVGRDLLEAVYNRMEGDDRRALPSHVRIEGEEYRLVGAKTRHVVDTVFGPVALWRHLYRPVARDSGEPSVAPLERALGVTAGATPALAEAAARYAAMAGATQRQVQDQLRDRHGVTIGTERLRGLLGRVSGARTEGRPEAQAAHLVDLLGRADASSGRTRPVLSVSRDGITLRENRHGLFEVATAATVTVSDRRGQRLGTVYLARAPELGQGQMTAQLTALIADVLQRWTGPLPRLAYVADAGDNETTYFDAVLSRMVHPRTGEDLSWYRVLDFYHAMERVWALADALFRDDARGRWAWGRRMGTLLKKPNGPFRVLHAAAAMRSRRVLTPTAKKEYDRAYRYIRTRTRWMQYHEYKDRHIPLGSGITEAACKTLFTQRLKLSGMRWAKAGAQVILDLRVALLSGIWETAYRQILTTYQQPELPTPPQEPEIPRQMAA